MKELKHSVEQSKIIKEADTNWPKKEHCQEARIGDPYQK
jgi:hypothetical protein